MEDTLKITKLCPYCGAELDAVEAVGRDESGLWCVVCECGAITDDVYYSADSAVFAWNSGWIVETREDE